MLEGGPYDKCDSLSSVRILMATQADVLFNLRRLRFVFLKMSLERDTFPPLFTPFYSVLPGHFFQGLIHFWSKMVHVGML